MKHLYPDDFFGLIFFINSFSFTFHFPICVHWYKLHLLHLLKSVTDVDCTLTSPCGSAVIHSALFCHFAISIRAALIAPGGPQQQFAQMWCAATRDYLKQEHVPSITRTVVVWSGKLE